MDSKKIIGIDLFSGAGGMSIGAEMAGIKIISAVEYNSQAAETYKRNHRDTEVINKDIKDVSFLDKEFVGTRVVFGGPPCQGFSTSNQKTRSAENPNNWLFRDYLRIVAEINPEWVVFENVKGIVETAGGIFIDEVLSGFESQGYTTTTMLLNAQDYGVPQIRNRYFVIASKEGRKVSIPTPITSNPITVKQAIEDLAVLDVGASKSCVEYSKKAESKYAKALRKNKLLSYNNLVSRNNTLVVKRYASIPPGGNWEDIPDDLMQNYSDKSRCHTGIYHRLDPDKPSIVIGNYRKNMLIHPNQNRGLSVREAARLQSFPDRFRFYGSIGFQQQQVGNAVPPLLARAVFQSFLGSL